MVDGTEETLLDVSGLDVSYGAVRALEQVDMHVKTGEVVVVLGANGAGKSTLLKTIAGLVKPKRGIVVYAGSPARESPDRLVRRGLSLVLEGHRVFPAHSVEDNLRLGGFQLSRVEARLRLGEMYEQFPLLKGLESQLAGTLSGGQQQIMCIARALMARPRLLMLDEPSLGLDPIHVESVFSAIRGARDAGSTVLLVEQKVGPALAAADRAYVLGVGRVVVSGSPDDLRSDPVLARAYLGTDV